MDGTYVLNEVTAPVGYNPLDDTITFEVKNGSISNVKIWDKDVTSDAQSGNSKIIKLTDSGMTLVIINELGVELPSTGSIGTIPFYIIGGVIVLGSAAVLLKRREQA